MNTKQLRQKILDLAIRGKLVPQDPNDEPASVLLERVRVEKEWLIKEGKIKRDKNDYGVDESDYWQLPEGWAWARLGKISALITDGEHLTPKRCKEYCGYYLLSARNVLDSEISLDNVDYVDAEEYARISKRCNPQRNDILISCSGSVGRVAVVNDDNHYVMVRSAAMAKPVIIVSHYIMFALQSSFLQEQISSNKKQVAQANLFQAEIRGLILPLPPLTEQHRIVAAVESALTVIDEIERNKTDLQTAVTTAKSKILSLAIRGKLVSQDPNDEPIANVLGRNKVINEEKPFDVPAGWEWYKLGDVCDYGACDKISEEQINENAWVLDLEDIEKDSANIIQMLTKNERPFKGTRNVFKKGQVLYSKLRPYLNKVVIAPQDGYCSLEILPLSLYNDTQPRYVQAYLMSDYFLLYANMCSHGVRMPRLGTTNGKNAPVPIPPIAEQKRIVAAVNAMFNRLNSIAESLVSESDLKS